MKTSNIESIRLALSQNTDIGTKSRLGQFFTPAITASFMVNLFPPSEAKHCKLLDAGAGIGSLAHAFLTSCSQAKFNFERIDLTSFELDSKLHSVLNQTFNDFEHLTGFNHAIVGEDFIEKSVNILQFEQPANYTHAILNPPYKKINSTSDHRFLLRKVGIEAVNLYSAFIALALLQMVENGVLVAIVPRSFCNGSYYLPFRQFLLKESSIEHIHLFESRKQIFKDDSVLQENIIIVLKRLSKQKDVVVSASKDNYFNDLHFKKCAFEEIVKKNDREYIVHIPNIESKSQEYLSEDEGLTLEEIGIQVSTGPVVDFRLKKHLRALAEQGCVPLLYPCHFSNKSKQCEWPKLNSKKPNAIQHNIETEKWLYPIGFYCVIKRFSSKEEKHRISASVIHPKMFSNTNFLGFENHLNILHFNKQGLPENMAWGLSAYLNSDAVDRYFRSFSGHTQVNASDLKRIKFPSKNNLLKMGENYKLQMTKLL
jgi:adenine-specific DNA-methyltransferase